ncbi:unnamed protein product, partial [Prorocentrum cordatum]
GRGLDLPTFDAAPLTGGLSPDLTGGLGAAGGSRAKARAGRAKADEPVAHAPLVTSSRERLQLFTPLAQQGAAAIRAETRLKEAGEKDLLEGVLGTLKSWVQECLAREERRNKLLAKGMLKCRVQATWSEGLHERIRRLVATYGGRLAADGEKENAPARPAWQLVRAEKWLVGFDAAAFEAFARAHPEVLGPPAACLHSGSAPLPLRLAEAALAPLGLRAEGGAPVMWPPAAVAAPILEGLKALEGSPGLHDALRGTRIGKVVNGYRNNPCKEVAQAARDLVASWKAAVRK